MTVNDDLASNYVYGSYNLKSWYEQHNCFRADVRIFVVVVVVFGQVSGFCLTALENIKLSMIF